MNITYYKEIFKDRSKCLKLLSIWKYQYYFQYTLQLRSITIGNKAVCTICQSVKVYRYLANRSDFQGVWVLLRVTVELRSFPLKLDGGDETYVCLWRYYPHQLRTGGIHWEVPSLRCVSRISLLQCLSLPSFSRYLS